VAVPTYQRLQGLVLAFHATGTRSSDGHGVHARTTGPWSATALVLNNQNRTDPSPPDPADGFNVWLFSCWMREIPVGNPFLRWRERMQTSRARNHHGDHTAAVVHAARAHGPVTTWTSATPVTGRPRRNP
jgi:hypothetical protein